MANQITELDQLLDGLDLDQLDGVTQDAEIDTDSMDYELRMGSAIATLVVKC